MQKSSSTHNSSAAHRRVQHSSTLNRKYVKRPANTRTRNRTAAINSAAEADARAVRAVQKAQIQKRRQVMAEEMNRSYPAAAKRGQVRAQGRAVQVQVSGGQKQQAQQSQAQRGRAQQTRAQQTQAQRQQKQAKDIPAQPHPLQTRAQSAARAAGAARSARATGKPQLTAQQRKDAAIASALRSVATMNQEEVITSQKAQSSNTIKSKKVKSRHTHAKQPGSGKRFLIAFSCAAACVVALAIFIGVNSPDLSVKVAAMQTGIDASYPSYVPRDYSLTDVMSENGKITMTFVDGDASFILTEEQSSWDTTALLNNYVKPNWDENYTATHEQGITIYMSGSNAVWVNGSIFYTIADENGDLTKKQIRNIITSL